MNSINLAGLVRAAGLVLMVFVISPASASAGTASVTGPATNVLDFTAKKGEKNSVVLSRDSGGYYVTDENQAVEPGAGCEATFNPNTVSCPELGPGGGITAVTAQLLDEDDSIRFFEPGPSFKMSDPQTFEGGAGNDVLTDHPATDDSLSGGPGNDKLLGSGGADELNGGGGVDLVDYTPIVGPGASEGPSDGVTVSLDGVANDGYAGEKDNVLPTVENVRGTGAADSLKGSAGANKLLGMGGDDRLAGKAGDDRLRGGLGEDRHSGGAGRDRIASRDDVADQVRCGASRDRVRADALDAVAASCEVIRLP